jgi:site-specific recombinase XerD
LEDEINSFIGSLATARGSSANTRLAYRNDLSQLRHFVAAERPQISSWARVDSLLLQAFLLQLKHKGASAATLARKVAALKAFYLYLLAKGVISANPAEALDAPAVPKHLPVPLSESQVDALLAAAEPDSPKGCRDRALLELLYSTGLRVSELIALPVSALDLESGMLRIEVGGEARTLATSARALQAVKAWLETGRHTFTARSDDGPLFVNSRGVRLTRQGIWLIIKHYVERAGIAGPVTPHSLRHAFAAHRLARGERIQDLQRLLGHAHLSTTLVYSRQLELGA